MRLRPPWPFHLSGAQEEQLELVVQKIKEFLAVRR